MGFFVRAGWTAALALLLLLPPAAAAERIVEGTVVRVDPQSRTLTVRDGMEVHWNFVVDRDAGIDLRPLREGERVRVRIGRATPPNMVTAADRLRKGDRVEKIPF